MKKRILSIFVATVLVLATMLSLSSCNLDMLIKRYSINFIVDGETYETAKSDGKTVELPADPTKDGMTFEGWYYDDGVWAEKLDPAAVESSLLKLYISVYAKFVEAEDNTPDGDNTPGDNDNTPGGDNTPDDGDDDLDNVDPDGWTDQVVTYTVTANVAGVTIEFTIGSAKTEKITDENGVAELKAEPGSAVTAKITAVPEGYVMPADTAIVFENKSATVTIEEYVAPTMVTYTVTANIAGVTITFTVDGEDKAVITGENGVATVEVVEDATVTAKVTAVPEGYVMPETADLTFVEKAATVNVAEYVPPVENVTYTVTANVAGVKIEFVIDGVKTPVTTGDDCVASISAPENATVTATVVAVPDGYDTPENNVIEFTDRQANITLIKTIVYETYTVTANIAGVTITFTVGGEDKAVTVGADLKASVEVVEGTEVTAKITAVPEGYVMPTDTAITFTDKVAAVEIAEISDEIYTVTVLVGANKLQGVEIRFVVNGEDTFAVTTDENGVAAVKVVKGSTVTAKVTAVPEGYVRPTASISFTDNAATVKVTKNVEDDNMDGNGWTKP